MHMLSASWCIGTGAALISNSSCCLKWKEFRPSADFRRVILMGLNPTDTPRMNPFSNSSAISRAKAVGANSTIARSLLFSIQVRMLLPIGGIDL